MTAGDLLGITRPEDLFPGDTARAKIVYRDLAMRWHPDRGGNPVVFAHITDLYQRAQDRLAHGLWEGSSVLNLQGHGRIHTFACRASTPFELGQSLVGDDHSTYIVKPEHGALVSQFDWSKKFKYANDRMREEFSHYLPTAVSRHQLEDGRYLIRVEKNTDLIRLRDVQTHVGVLDVRHAAWIISSLYNLACYLSYQNIVHHDISPDTYFISPRYHAGALLGGWWYARRRGSPVAVVPRRTMNVLPFKVRVTKRASTLTDLELIRQTARELMSDPPAPIRMWLQQVGQDSAVSQYGQWMDVLTRSFGVRKFVKLDLDANRVYGHHGKPA